MTGQLKFLLKFFLAGGIYMLFCEAVSVGAGYYLNITWGQWISSSLLIAVLMALVPAFKANPALKNAPLPILIFCFFMLAYVFMLPPNPGEEIKQYRFFERSQFSPNLAIKESGNQVARFMSFREGILDYNFRETYRENNATYEATPLLKTEGDRSEPVRIWLVCRVSCPVGIPLNFQIVENFKGEKSPSRSAVLYAMQKHSLDTDSDALIVDYFPHGANKSEVLAKITQKIKTEFFSKLGFWVFCHAVFGLFLFFRPEKQENPV